MKTDWETVKTAYVTSAKTLAEIAADFKQNLDVVRRHAAKERWTEQRKLWRVTTTKQATEKRSSEMATDVAQFASDSLKLARAGFSMVLADMKSATSPPHQIASALKGFQEVGMRALGETTETDKDININVKYDK